MKIIPFRVITMLALMLFVASCTDHEVPEPEKVPAKIKTLPLKHGVPIATFYVQFEDLGNIPIVEYGVVMSTGVAGYLVALPTVADEVLIFSEPANNLDKKTQTQNKTFADANYRAYAKLSDGTVVYGELLKFRFEPG
ncbi:hypothetical protein [Dyadobacter sp. CY326]|uniref:hypothetical protein n=1 Tax=Dyadobacter sp. CY326 TaxID=2907300 RepID=UPI001F1CAC47|nr:hypothetical protein [Dyadobacter sp. CY326]MCE7066959.1 hypothetical protein [Dyadobacter sp. CY326]